MNEDETIGKIANNEDYHIKAFIWGDSGTGKSRFALTFPNPLVIDFEGSTRLYSNEFDFCVAEIDKNNIRANNPAQLISSVIEEIKECKYGCDTLIIDPVTELFESLEDIAIHNFEEKLGKKITELNQIQKAKWYSYRRNLARKMLDKLKELPINVVLIARSKTLWDLKDGKTLSAGVTYDSLDIIEYLMDINMEFKNVGGDTLAIVKKSRNGKLNQEVYLKDYNQLINLLEGK